MTRRPGGGGARPAARLAAYGVMLLFTVFTVGPLVWLFYSSFKTNGAIIQHPFSLPLPPTLENYLTAWQLGQMGILFLNSLIYTGAATALTVFLGVSTGYAFARFKFRITGFLYFFILLGLLITVQSVLAPLFVVETRLGIADTRLGVIIPYVAFGLPVAIYLATSYIAGIPVSLEESAIIDGASYLGVFWSIILPISRPVVATMTILTFLSNWNEFVLILVLTSRGALRSLSVGINAFAGVFNVDYGLQFAALVIGTVPVIIFYFLFHERLAQGFAEGALKE
jgi:raffinose/stachyose/melibiose transport system permease protein